MLRRGRLHIMGGAGLALLLGPASVLAAPLRGPAAKLDDGMLDGRNLDVVVIKLREGLQVDLQGGRLLGVSPSGGEDMAQIDALTALLDGPLVPRFSRGAALLRLERETWDPEHNLADLSLYFLCQGPGAYEHLDELNRHPWVEQAYLAWEPIEPPVDYPPTTPDFTDLQSYLGAAPDGLAFQQAALWPGGDGANVAVVDIEYGWDPDHEDLEATVDAFASGSDSGDWRYHGDGVLGELFGGDNGYGVIGMVPAAEPLVVSPYGDRGRYDVADAIDRAAALLDAGDVILIEQQAYLWGNYCPVEADQAVFDAISLAVAKGIVVVEPAGNGAQDLDDGQWNGAFDRTQRDSGAILVGGGASPLSGELPRTWYPYGSCYGSRVDVQAWYDGIVTATNADYGSSFADLFLPGGDGLQAYTSQFGGTSGASPMITAVAAVLQSVAWELHGQPFDPVDLRSMLVSTGSPQPVTDAEDFFIGPQPDLRRLLRTYLSP